MATNETPLSDLISSVEQVGGPEISPEDLGEKPKNQKSKTFPIIVGILLVLILGMGGYYVYNNYFAPEEVEQTQEEWQEEESSALTSQYYNETFGVKFTYPTGWIVEEEVDENIALLLQIKEKEEDPEFIFEYTYDASIGLNYCYYDAATFEETGTGDGTLYTEYTEIGDDKLLRRSFVEDESKYIVCSLDDYANKYGIWLDDGVIEYVVNMEREDAEDMLKVMDNITLSFVYTGGDFSE